MPDHEPTGGPATLASASVSAAGGRPDNQDRCGEGATGAGGRAFVVADGLGGHAAGDLAAERAVAALLGALAQRAALAPGALARAFDAAGAAIRACLVPVTETETVATRDALGRVLAQDIVPRINVPGHDNSAMDGYAVRFSDLKGETTLRQIGTDKCNRRNKMRCISIQRRKCHRPYPLVRGRVINRG